MFLQQHIGKIIAIKLRKGVANQDIFKILYRDITDDTLIMEKLIDVDELGLWIEGSGYMTVETDENGNLIPSEVRKRELVTAHNLVRWEYIEGVFVLEQDKIENKKIGFSGES